MADLPAEADSAAPAAPVGFKRDSVQTDIFHTPCNLG